jgi:hypothetical protein
MYSPFEQGTEEKRKLSVGDLPLANLKQFSRSAKLPDKI